MRYNAGASFNSACADLPRKYERPAAKKSGATFHLSTAKMDQ